MKKQKVSRLTLNRETLQNLDHPVLRWAKGGDGSSQCSEVCCPDSHTCAGCP